ncbi:MAG TPA: SAM-dependent methyltransferase [Lentimicrobium sp.]|nr:SAM-dependent methyltransferase [Lentimicrobium sp.]
MSAHKGILYLIPTPLGDVKPEIVLPASNFSIISNINVFIVEELRTARRFLRNYGYNKNFDEVTFHILNEHTHSEETAGFLNEADKGISIGLLSEAGVPAIADPGAVIVRLAHEKNIKVVPLIGPSSILLALMASGLNGQEFTFHGYLPVKPNERKQWLRDLNKRLLKQSHTHIFIEAPYRNKQIIDSILETISEDTLLCIATNVSLPEESILTKSIREWKRIKPDPGKNPTVFLLM